MAIDNTHVGQLHQLGSIELNIMDAIIYNFLTL